MSLARRIDRGLGIGAVDTVTPIGVGSAAYSAPPPSALAVSPEGALKISAAWACIRLLSESIAALPLQVFRRADDGGRAAATQHPLYSLLHDAPNDSAMTAMEFRQMLTSHLLLRGNAYALIQPGPRGVVDQLLPLVPEQVAVQQNDDWTLSYRVFDPRTRNTRVYVEDEIFHLRGLSLDGRTGLSVVSYAARSLGLAAAADEYATRFFSSDARPQAALKSEKELSEVAQERLRASWAEIYGGLSNAGKVAVLEDGIDYVQLSFNPEDSQLLQMREFSVADVARWYNVPLHMIQSETKDTSWGSGIEQLSIGFVTWSLLPWLKRWEQTINRRLIMAPQTYYSEHEVAGLLRGDLKTRYEAYAIGRQWGWLSVNAILALENENPIGPQGDIYLSPMNMVDSADFGDAEAALPAPARGLPPAAGGPRGEQLALVARAAAERVIRKESAALDRLRARHAGDPAAYARAVDAFYDRHAGWTAGVLGIPAARAEDWARDRRAEVLRLGDAATRNDAVAQAHDALTALALADGRTHAHA